ncbi:MAG: hypothetical protein POELPBGB_00172 [Bacteroidia bacterium]|nr:hypothetical protein [Bacteroidia bacterium]
MNFAFKSSKESLYRIILLIFLTVSFASYGQKMNDGMGGRFPHPVDLRKAVSSFNCGKVESADTAVVKQYLLSAIANLKGSDFSIDFLEGKQSKTGLHYLYRQNYRGKPVYRGTIKINLDKNGSIISLFDNTYRILETPAGEFPDTDDCYDIIKSIYKNDNDIVKIFIEELYFDLGPRLIPASRIELWDKKGNFFELVIDADQMIVYERDMNSYFNNNRIHDVDTPALARVFNPDPLTTAGVIYGAPYEDASDADISQLNMQRQQVTLDVAFENDTFKLESPYCLITDHSIPDVAPVTSLTPDFEFTRSQDGFEDVNAFYHINVYHDYVQQLGFDNIVNYPIWVDTHAMGGADNSNFSAAGSPPRLSFGEGGVDDAEDADVIIHEYGHAISHSAAPGTNSGAERLALDEAIGDYFAASYSKSINSFNWEKMFSWDGHNEFWNGRVVESDKHYPEDLQNNLYKDAELWSSTMMQIMDDIGRERTDEIMIEALHSFATNISMTDAANLVIAADVALNGGGYVAPIRYWMCLRGFIPCNVGVDELAETHFAVINSYGFTARNEQAVIRFNSPQTGLLELTDATGRIIYSEKFSEADELKISPKNVSSGIYLTKVTTQNFSSTYKLMKW